MTAFGPLRSVFSPRELNDLVSAMIERGIRLRKGLEQYLEGWIDPDTVMDVDEALGETEVERMIHETRKLMPY